MHKVTTEPSGVAKTGTHAVREVVRFSATERAFHWAFAVSFLGLLLSGLPLSFPVLRPWISGYSVQIGLRLHLVCAAAWMLGPALVVALGDRGALGRAATDLFRVGRAEWSWVLQLPRWLAGLPCRMQGVGRFNAGQKVNGLFVALVSIVFGLTGATLWILWQWPGLVSIRVPLTRAILEGCRWVHYAFTLLILAPLLGHIALATVHPRTRESLRGMVFGAVDGEWARSHHPAWFAETTTQAAGSGDWGEAEAPPSLLRVGPGCSKEWPEGSGNSTLDSPVDCR
jgi:formate dehydrogenase subunit gamma